jgi:hypothetical protein
MTQNETIIADGTKEEFKRIISEAFELNYVKEKEADSNPLFNELSFLKGLLKKTKKEKKLLLEFKKPSFKIEEFELVGEEKAEKQIKEYETIEYEIWYSDYKEASYKQKILDLKSDKLAEPMKKDFLDKNQQPTSEDKGSKKVKKISEKFYALHYWMELMAHGKKTPLDLDGCYVKSDLIEIGKKKCNSKGQTFYRAFINIDLNDAIRLNKGDLKGWKEIVIEMSKNDQVTLDYINNKFNEDTKG